ncbi:hypothetical protein Hanom_Chr07g00679641 [Helianthus anomalus]
MIINPYSYSFSLPFFTCQVLRINVLNIGMNRLVISVKPDIGHESGAIKAGKNRILYVLCTGSKPGSTGSNH